MKRMLYIAPHDLNKRAGGALATLAYLNALLSLYGEAVDIMMPAEANDGSIINVISVPSRSHLNALLSGSLHRYKSAVRNHLKKHVNEYEACVINGGLYAGDMMDMIHSFGLRIMVIHHNFEREYAMDNKGVLTLGGRTSYFIVKNEKNAYLKADINCFLTAEDIKLFENHYGKARGKSQLIGVFEPKDVELSSNNNYNCNTIAITGSMNSVQTMSGITDIHKNYYSIISELCPEWQLVIAGRNPHGEVYELQKENPTRITVVPNPPDMDIITNRASIFLCPTNVGGGLKLRIMDGLRMGLPILVHKVSARGYDAFFEKDYFQVYDNPESFRKGLKELLKYCSSGYEHKMIQRDYLNTFSFKAGRIRMKMAIDMMVKG